MRNESRRPIDGNTNRSTAEGNKSMGDSRDVSPTIASERALNGAILAAEISESYEEYLEIFDHFYADDARRSEWRDGFLFLGNHLALDFLNTCPVQNGEAVELLPDFGLRCLGG